MSELLRSIDPATGETVWEGRATDPAALPALVAGAKAASRAWSREPVEARVEAVRRYKAVLETRAPAMAEAISRETGKALWETRAELTSMINKVEISIRAHEERTGTRAAATGFGRAVLRHKPHGVAAVLGPFNFPGHLPNGHIVPALLAGDAVVFKPSEETPWTGELMVQAFEEAGLPKGLVNLAQGGRDVGAALLDQEIDALFFTGSAAAGAFFRRRFVDNPHVILALELGGNNPLVVGDVGDVEAAASIVVQSAFVTTGQRCSCARRLIVPEGAKGDALLAGVSALADRLVIGRWNDAEEPYMGPLISARAAEAALAAAKALGGRTLRPLAARQDLGPAFVSPGMIDVTGVEVPDEEIFAPVLQVTRYDGFARAVELANATKYGLSAGLISDDAGEWDAFLGDIRAGVVNWNRPTTGAAGDMPFGGLGASGNHRPSAYYAADYCAYPVASFEATAVKSVLSEMKGVRP